MARAEKPPLSFLAPGESRLLYHYYVHPTKAEEEQALTNALLKFSQQKRITRGERLSYQTGYAKLLLLQKMDEQQYQRALEQRARDIQSFPTEEHVKLGCFIALGILVLLLLSALL